MIHPKKNDRIFQEFHYEFCINAKCLTENIENIQQIIQQQDIQKIT